MDHDRKREHEIEMELLAQLRSGDVARSWAGILELYEPMMIRTATAFLGVNNIERNDPAVGSVSAHDIVHDVVSKLMTKGPALADQIESTLGGYLRRATRYRAINAHRRTDFEITEDPDEIGKPAPDVSEKVVDDELVDAALRPLADRDRQVIVEHVMYGRTMAAVGRDLKVSDTTVRKIRERVLGDIRDRLGGVGDE
jgi:RNA polymerase sigma factor (sigma-70 family)